MKKHILLLSLILLLTAACGNKEEETTAQGDNQMQKNEETKNTPPPVKTQEESQKIVQKEPVPTFQADIIDNTKFKDLVSKYTKAIIKTNLGDITVQFYNQETPKTVNNFLNLADMDFYDKTKFHRVIKDFMIQGGDQNSKDDDWSNDGLGGPGYKFEDEQNAKKLTKGSLAMANSGPNTNGSQFFIVTAASTPWLDGKHTNFGEVIEGINVVEQIENVNVDTRDHPTQDIIIKSIKLVK